jgi:protein gp37
MVTPKRLQMPAHSGRDWWWDCTWNPVGGCKAESPGCVNCYAAQEAGTKTWPYAGYSGVHNGVTVKVGTGRAFNGKYTAAPEWHPQWTFPLTWKGAKHPKLGAGQPSLIFVGDMSDVFYEPRDAKHIHRVCSTIALSDHIGLLLTKRAHRMAEFITVQDHRTVRQWQPRLWLGFSAENQTWFDRRWGELRPLAGGWFVFVSIAPILGPVVLPGDFLALGARVWVIVAGEQGARAHVREMKASWARSLRDQCRAAGIPFFFKQMAGGAPIPPDLHIREFPLIGSQK